MQRNGKNAFCTPPKITFFVSEHIATWEWLCFLTSRKCLTAPDLLSFNQLELEKSKQITILNCYKKKTCSDSNRTEMTKADYTDGTNMLQKISEFLSVTFLTSGVFPIWIDTSPVMYQHNGMTGSCRTRCSGSSDRIMEKSTGLLLLYACRWAWLQIKCNAGGISVLLWKNSRRAPKLLFIPG